MDVILIGGPYHGHHGIEPIAPDGSQIVRGPYGEQRYQRFLIAGPIMFCRHESLSDEYAERMIAALGPRTCPVP